MSHALESFVGVQVIASNKSPLQTRSSGLRKTGTMQVLTLDSCNVALIPRDVLLLNLMGRPTDPVLSVSAPVAHLHIVI